MYAWASQSAASLRGRELVRTTTAEEVEGKRKRDE